MEPESIVPPNSRVLGASTALIPSSLEPETDALAVELEATTLEKPQQVSTALEASKSTVKKRSKNINHDMKEIIDKAFASGMIHTRAENREERRIVERATGLSEAQVKQAILDRRKKLRKEELDKIEANASLTKRIIAINKELATLIGSGNHLQSEHLHDAIFKLKVTLENI